MAPFVGAFFPGFVPLLSYSKGAWKVTRIAIATADGVSVCDHLARSAAFVVVEVNSGVPGARRRGRAGPRPAEITPPSSKCWPGATR